MAHNVHSIMGMLSLLLLLFTLFPQSFADSFDGFICGDVKTYDLQEDMAQNLIFSQSINQGLALPSKFIQCGLPGLDWRVCSKCETRNHSLLLDDVVNMLSSKEHRDWHYYWHSIRRELSFDLNNLPPSIERLEGLVQLGWIELSETKNSYSKADFTDFIKNHSAGGKLAGEDFLYMHRQMIKMLQVEQGAKGKSCIAPWHKIPNSLLDEEWPVPRAVYFSEQKKNIQYEQMELEAILFLAQNLQDESYLKTVSLNRLGIDIEDRIHGKLHILYASPFSQCINSMEDNSIECSDLSHDRSSHVNKYFWKLHGFIDQLIGDWLKANGYKYIYKNCKDSPSPDLCYQWKGTWLGKEPFPITGN